MSARTILVVDDNLDFAQSIVALLQLHGRNARASGTVRQALDLLDEDSSIALVVSDVRMPDVDGLDLRRVLRHRFTRLPVVLMTGLPLTSDDVLPHGTLILQKPFPIERLIEAIDERLPPDPPAAG